jgi:hypothetical protein
MGYLAVDRLYRVTTARNRVRPPYLKRKGQRKKRMSRC